MSNYDQNQAAATAAHPEEPQVSYMSAPPPAGYPVKDESQDQAPAPATTQSRGDGFWKGCCAALCCCCMLDACF